MEYSTIHRRQHRLRHCQLHIAAPLRTIPDDPPGSLLLTFSFKVAGMRSQSIATSI
jgi:hypothetical protein